MAAIGGKRKREDAGAVSQPAKKPAFQATATGQSTTNRTSKAGHQTRNPTANGVNGDPSTTPVHVQIVTGSYERVLHGITATIPRSRLISPSSHPRQAAPAESETEAASTDEVAFAHNFLFAAHSSAIRCLAISPPTEEANKRLLATGSSDERINLYSLSTIAPAHVASQDPQVPSLLSTPTAFNPRNRTLGSLNHHSRAVTALSFPTRSKLFSSAEDCTIGISRTRDWTLLSSIKAPLPKSQGRPSGDTAAPGEIPAGVNAFAIHPSQKLMLSVGRGERCMRLWNLMTGKKAGVLNFDREVREQVGEGKFGSGEGRRVLWDPNGESFVVGFERGAVIYGVDSKPRAVVRAGGRSMKVHQMRFVPLVGHDATSVLAVSTEDGRILFFDTSSYNANDDAAVSDDRGKLPTCPCIAELGGTHAGLTGRIKDFEIVEIATPDSKSALSSLLLFITASSDGAIRLWTVSTAQLVSASAARDNEDSQGLHIGELIATHETGDRITCIGGFVMEEANGDEAADDFHEGDSFEGFDDEEEDEEDEEDE